MLPLVACKRDSDEERLRRRIQDMRAAIGDRKIAGFMAGVAADFIGPGGLDRDGVQGLLRLQLLRHRETGVTLGPMDLELRGSEAEVSFKAVLADWNEALLPDGVRGWTVHSGWRDGADGWQVVQARWEPVF